MPQLWNETIAEHRRSVREVILDKTAALVAERGLRAVTMSEIAESSGIGRSTLYKYYPDLESILSAWHRTQITHHLGLLGRVRDQEGTPQERLHAVLAAYAGIQRERVGRHRDQPHGHDLTVVLHGDPHVEEAQRALHGIVETLIAEAVANGTTRADVPVHELAAFCIHALDRAGRAASDESVARLLTLTLASIRPEA